MGAQPLADRVAVEVGQEHVQQDDIRPQLFGLFDAVMAVNGFSVKEDAAKN